MRLSELCAELSEYMARYPQNDPVVEIKVDAVHPLHDPRGKEIGEVSVQTMYPVDHTKYVTQNNQLIGVWVATEEAT